MIPSVERVEVMLSAEVIRNRVAELGRDISEAYRGRDLTLVGILKGSVPFLADLVRAIDVPVQIDFLEVSSYKGGMESSGVVRLVKDLSHSIDGKNVLIVEDIVDTGLTLLHLKELLATRRPASLEICSLLDKPEGRKVGVEVPIRWVGFTIPNRFVVGYGLDLGGYLRNLPYVGIYHPPEATP